MRNPTVDDTRAAVRWALNHDLPALLDYRQVAHLDRGGRRQADATLVARWQAATGRRVRPPLATEHSTPLPRRVRA
ncbi:hypothetical protein [Isoptericola aurantiacus]|uniref:hypothetical protein n=1 Tax=Isoptericola aurantiacus TaxID=3377839 RepID=UPI00383A4E69